jgi:hypothetical protein
LWFLWFLLFIFLFASFTNSRFLCSESHFLSADRIVSATMWLNISCSEGLCTMMTPHPTWPCKVPNILYIRLWVVEWRPSCVSNHDFFFHDRESFSSQSLSKKSTWAWLDDGEP